MKKILFLLLSTIAMYGQVPADATPLENIQITNNIEDLATDRVSVPTTDGVINWKYAKDLKIPTKAFLPTGLLKNGALSINAVNTTYDLSAGTGIITNFDNPDAPTSRIVTFPAVIGKTPTYLTTAIITYVGIQEIGTSGVGQIIEQATPFTTNQNHDLIPIGAVIHSNLTNINVVNNITNPSNDIGGQFHTFLDKLGAFNVTGNKFTANGANLGLDKSAGSLYKRGSNFINNWKNANEIAQPATTYLTFRYRNQLGVEGSDRVNLDPSLYDVGGVETTVPVNKFTIQTVNQFQENAIRVQKGQTIYNSLAEAEAALPTRVFVKESNIALQAVPRAYVILKNTATSLLTAADAKIIEAGKFDGFVSGGAALTLDAIISALGYTPENVANKVSTLTASAILYPNNNAIINSIAYKRTISQIRALTGTLPNNNFYTTDIGQEGNWYYDSTDTTSLDNTGTILVTADGKRIKRVIQENINVKWFGAKGDGVTDDYTSIQNALNYSSEGKILIFPKVSAGYSVSNSLTASHTIKGILMTSPIICTFSSDIVGLTIGSSGNVISNSVFKLNIQKSTVSNWDNESSIGLLIINANTCEIDISEARGFTIGTRLLGDSGGFSYNNVILGSIINNKIGIDLASKSTTSVGWINENIFTGGRFARFSGINVGKGNVGIRIKSIDGGYTNNNNNRFIKPSIELGNSISSPQTSIPIVIDHGNLNVFEGVRNEGNGEYIAIINNESSENTIKAGFGTAIVQDNSIYPVTSSLNSRNVTINDAKFLIFDSGFLPNKASYFNATSTVNLIGANLNVSTNALIYDNATATIYSDYISFGGTRAVGIFVDTSIEKKLVLRRNTVLGYGGRVNIRCYDVNGLLMDGSSSQLIKSSSAYVLTYNSGSYGGTYRSGIDSNSDLYISVDESVKKIQVMLTGGTQELRLKSFSIYSLGGASSSAFGGVTFDGKKINTIHNIADAIPAIGAWNKGKIIINSNPTSGAPYGWACTVSGTPGTWLPISYVDSNNSTALIGVPTAPTAVPGTNTTQIANAAFTQQELNSRINGSTNYIPKFDTNNAIEISSLSIEGGAVTYNTIYTVATLPTPTGKAFAVVTDATAPTYLGTLTGGGSVVCPVFFNGTIWVSH